MDSSKDWNNYMPPAYESQSNLFSQTSSQNVYSGPIENASSITMDTDATQDNEHTRIYAATKSTIVVDDLYLANLPSDANPNSQDSTDDNQA